MATPTPETNLQRFYREGREAQERLRAEQARDPQFAAMSKADAMTKDEAERIAAAEQAVADAKEAVNRAGLALSRAEKGEKAYDAKRPFSFFERPKEHYKAAAAAVGDLRIDLQEARSAEQSAIRRRNQVVADVKRARAERRQAAKLKHAPPKPPTRLHRDWSTPREAA